VADSLVDTLVSQSLDLPPQAARWRHRQRAAAASRRRGPLTLRAAGDAAGDGDDSDEVDDEEEEEDGGEEQRDRRRGLIPLPGRRPPAKRDVRSRTAGMLAKDRSSQD